MNRLGFFSEMKKGLLDTIKAVYEPILEEKLEQIDRAADTILQIHWVAIGEDFELFPSTEQKIIKGINVLILRTGENIQAVDCTCPVCLNLLYFSESDQELKCFMCEKQYLFRTGEGELLPAFLPVRKKNKQYEIGIEARRK